VAFALVVDLLVSAMLVSRAVRASKAPSSISPKLLPQRWDWDFGHTYFFNLCHDANWPLVSPRIYQAPLRIAFRLWRLEPDIETVTQA
jgi:hypothetical protein